MLKPADGIEGVKNAILTAVSDAGPNACPPMVVGVGVGGTFEKCAIMAKKALTREAGTHSDIEYVAELEKEMLEKINNLGIGPGCGKYLLSRKPPCSEGIVKNYCIEEERKWQF